MDVYIIGCGGNSKVVIDICELNGYNVIGIFDDKYNGNQQEIYKRCKLIGTLNDINKYQEINIINSIGDNSTRYKIYKRLESTDLNWINCIHPQTYLSSTVKLGKGNILCYGCFINCDAVIGDFNLINTYSVIEHDCSIGNFNHIAPRATMCGGISIGDLNLLGVSSSIIPGKKIGNKNIIGAMSAIINNYENDQTIVGVPGKVKNRLTA